jgi:hypothetical protein
MKQQQTWLAVGLFAALSAAAAPPMAQASPGKSVGSCSEATVVERHYGPTQRSASGSAVKEVYLSLSDGEHLDGPAQIGTTGFFWDYTPGNKVGICVEALHPSRLRVNDRITGASFEVHPSAPSSAGG